MEISGIVWMDIATRSTFRQKNRISFFLRNWRPRKMVSCAGCNKNVDDGGVVIRDGNRVGKTRLYLHLRYPHASRRICANCKRKNRELARQHPVRPTQNPCLLCVFVLCKHRFSVLQAWMYRV